MRKEAGVLVFSSIFVLPVSVRPDATRSDECVLWPRLVNLWKRFDEP